jgi:hypothetical protein
VVKYRKLPVVIEAIQITRESIEQVLNDEPSELDRFNGLAVFPDYVRVVTLEGVVRGEIGDWLITGVNGELYPCKDDIFRKTYEAVE